MLVVYSDVFIPVPAEVQASIMWYLYYLHGYLE